VAFREGLTEPNVLIGEFMINSAKEEFGLGKIGQIAVPVSDIEQAMAFYRDVLGMRFLFQAPPDLAFFDCVGVRLMLDGPAKAQAGNSSVLYYQVPDLDVAFETLSARGLVFESEPHLVAKLPDHELWMAFFRDPDTNLLALMSEVRP
jgi:methylmalonyl-CoA/ethylmalonyl-CoA epimerase